MRDAGVFSIRRALPRMSWSPKNLYNLWSRTVGPKSEEITFKLTTGDTLFQQRWKSKAAVRAYHGDYISEKVFKRWYLPETIPDVRPRRKVLAGDDKASLEEFARRRKKEKDLEEEMEKKGMAPVGSLMFSEVERRIDVFIFRCCFAHSIYEARRLVIHGNVLLNGKKHNNANTRLAPGDMVSVDPSAIRFFKPPHGEYDDVIGTIAASKVDAGSPPAEGTAAEPPQKDSKPPDSLTPFHLPTYASPWLFIPAYIEPSFPTCSAIYVRHPTARPGYSEIPTPYDADGALVRFAWEWYVQRRPRLRTASQLSRMPEDRALAMREDIEDGRRHLKLDIGRLERVSRMKTKSKSAVGPRSRR
ncbi:hypothetical protein K443DRAFT_678653 [Laccaria amethystina LaAM-08-1]|uniref:Unplaced genomic scaffold K443scaffold_76, whole genome shotgun sequence n=1 Tax=Laccaria amethystina LaAM-08-1 TaxID=1095629 RepID=A0A0C9XI21_9AGAR|nr:hypothetical protein K443DRAFT_678653 [Laccaria amethystina LaAM-08-1]